MASSSSKEGGQSSGNGGLADDYSNWRFPHEDLRVYKNSIEFLRRVQALRVRGCGDVKAQLSRAAVSVTLNVCEGRAQRYAGNTGINYYRIALGSAAECHGAVDALAVVSGRDYKEHIGLLREIGAQLSKLIRSVN